MPAVLTVRRGVAAAGVAVVAAGAIAVLGGGAAQGRTTTSHVKARESRGLSFSRSRITVRHGRVKLVMSNPSGNRLPHAIAVEGHGIDRDGRTARPGGTSRLTLTLKKGRYEFYCPVDGHKAAGMKGTLIVK